MADLSLGIIEVVGLAGAVEAADICLKSANVKLIGYELTNGDGMAVVKIEGNVGDVKAAIEASRTAAAVSGKVYGYKVIPRPSDEIRFLVRNENTIGYVSNEKNEIGGDNIKEHYDYDKDIELNKDVQVDAEYDNKENKNYMVDDSETVVSKSYNIFNETNESSADDKININGDTEKRYTCNLCKDPACPRHKGELRSTCIHYNSNENSMTQEE